MLKICIAALSLLLATGSVALCQDASLLSCMAMLCNVSDPEDIPSEEMERLEYYAANPVKINQVSLGKLLSSGLFSRYQVASLADYRKSGGDVLSFAELATLDGFGEEFVRALRPFISLVSTKTPGFMTEGSTKVKGNILAKAGVKAELKEAGEAQTTFGLKSITEIGNGAEVFLSAKSGYAPNPFPIQNYGYGLTIYPQSHPWRVILGNFNARFGQGMALWSGFSMDSYYSPSSFCRRASGLSPSHSWSSGSALNGVAADLRFKQFILSSFVSVSTKNEFMPGANLAWRGKGMMLSCTGVWKEKAMTTAADLRATIRGWDIFAEGAYVPQQRLASAVTGVSVPVREGRLAGRAEWHQGKSFRVTTGYENKALSASCDYTLKGERQQMKLFYRQKIQVSKAILSSARTVFKWTPKDKYPVSTGLRWDLNWTHEDWQAAVRIEGVHCQKYGFLSYAECGRKGEKLFFWLRGCWWSTAGWADRIYCYERDIPGSFSVPAYYGRGFSASAYGGFSFGKPCLRMKTYARFWLRQPGISTISLALKAEF